MEVQEGHWIWYSDDCYVVGCFCIVRITVPLNSSLFSCRERSVWMDDSWLGIQ